MYRLVLFIPSTLEHLFTSLKIPCTNMHWKTYFSQIIKCTQIIQSVQAKLHVRKVFSYFNNILTTVCPRSSDPFYIVSNYII